MYIVIAIRFDGLMQDLLVRRNRRSVRQVLARSNALEKAKVSSASLTVMKASQY